MASIKINCAPKNVTEENIEPFLFALQKMSDNYYAKQFPTLEPVEFEADFGGSKNIRIISVGPSQNSVHCFIEKATGNIMKAAGWKAPVKECRGNIFENDHGMKYVTQYGVHYQR